MHEGNLHKDHSLIFKFYIWEHLELKLELKLSNMYAYVTYFTTVFISISVLLYFH